MNRCRFATFALVLAPFIALSFGTSAAHAAPCPQALVATEAAWKDARSREVPNVAERERLIAASDANLATEKDGWFDRFRAGESLPSLDCLTDDAFRRRFAAGVNASFFSRTLSTVESTGGASARAFAQAVRARFGSAYLPGFQVFSEWAPRDTTLPAGFDRGAGAVFVRLSRLTPAAWFVYFLHEMGHALDARLASAERMAVRASPLAARIATTPVGNNAPQFDPNNEGRLASAFAWIDLERGYLSEVRAWKTVFDVLSELPDDVVPREQLVFLETPFGSAKRFTELDIHAALFERFSVNDTGFYSGVAARTGLEAARAQLARAAATAGWNGVETASDEAFRLVEEFLKSDSSKESVGELRRR